MLYELPKKGFKFLSKIHKKVYYYDPVANVGQWTPLNLEYTIKLPPNWDIVKTQTDKMYFYNSLTNKNQYKIPEGTLVNPFENIGDPMGSYYENDGIALEDYDNTIEGLKAMGVNISTKNITEIYGGCKGPRNLNNFIDNLYIKSPNIINIDLSGCDITPEVVKKLSMFTQLKYVSSTKPIQNLSFGVINIYSDLTSWLDYTWQFEASLGGHIQTEWSKDGWEEIDVIKGLLLGVGLDSQEGYNEIITSFIKGASIEDYYYWGEMLNEILRLFLKNGSNPNLYRLLKEPNFTFDYSIDQEENSIKIKAKIIDTLYQINPIYVSDEKLNQKLPPNWNNIYPEWWLETDNNTSPPEIQYWENMKYFSTRLNQFQKY